jgi:hypothetical protein
MDDAMLDLMADHGGLRRRLDAYADARLSPDLTATTRMRSRVLAVAHRQSALARSDAALALIPDPLHLPAAAPRRATIRRASRSALRRAATVVLAAGLALASVSAVALAARPGGGLYDVRVWAETITLPSDPGERALRELDRLRTRLAEIASATAGGDADAAQAALLAYQQILAQATADALAADDDIAQVVLMEGVADNIAVLAALVDRLPAGGSEAVERAIERAIERSNDAIESFGPGHGGGSDGGTDNGNGVPGGQNATPGPTAPDAPEPAATPKPTKTPRPEATPKPEATLKPEATPKPTAPPKPDPTPEAERTARPAPPDPGSGGGSGGGQRTPPPAPPGRGG